MVYHMRTLASRAIISERLGKAAKIVAIAGPMVLVECHSIPKDVPRAPVVVIIEAPAITGNAQTDGAPAGERHDQPAAPKQMSTVLNAGINPGCVIEARLSVIRSDNTLEKVILDPKADFFYEAKNAHTQSDIVLGLCSGVPECEVPEFVRANLPHIILLNYPNKVEMDFIVSFQPAPGSRLAPSETTLRITQDELFSYCH